MVLAVRSGALSLSEACNRYMLSNEEFTKWQDAFERDGVAGLQAKRLVTDRVVSDPRKKVNAAD